MKTANYRKPNLTTLEGSKRQKRNFGATPVKIVMLSDKVWRDIHIMFMKETNHSNVTHVTTQVQLCRT